MEVLINVQSFFTTWNCNRCETSIMLYRRISPKLRSSDWQGRLDACQDELKAQRQLEELPVLRETSSEL